MTLREDLVAWDDFQRYHAGDDDPQMTRVALALASAIIDDLRDKMTNTEACKTCGEQDLSLNFGQCEGCIAAWNAYFATVHDVGWGTRWSVSQWRRLLGQGHRQYQMVCSDCGAIGPWADSLEQTEVTASAHRRDNALPMPGRSAKETGWQPEEHTFRPPMLLKGDVCQYVTPFGVCGAPDEQHLHVVSGEVR